MKIIVKTFLALSFTYVIGILLSFIFDKIFGGILGTYSSINIILIAFGMTFFSNLFIIVFALWCYLKKKDVSIKTIITLVPSIYAFFSGMCLVLANQESGQDKYHFYGLMLIMLLQAGIFKYLFIRYFNLSIK